MAEDKTLGIFFNPDSGQAAFPATVEALNSVLGKDFACRLYQLMGESLLANHGEPHHGVLVTVAMTPQPQAEDDFNAWYTEEHLAMLRAVPSWVSSQRYILFSATDRDAPRYLAMHKWTDRSFLESKEFKAATNTPWRDNVMATIAKRERFLFELQGARYVDA